MFRRVFIKPERKTEVEPKQGSGFLKPSAKFRISVVIWS
jgi:hypothetical protein